MEEAGYTMKAYIPKVYEPRKWPDTIFNGIIEYTGGRAALVVQPRTEDLYEEGAIWCNACATFGHTGACRRAVQSVGSLTPADWCDEVLYPV